MKILIIDDDRTVCVSLKLLLSRKGFDAIAIHHPSVAMDTIAAERPQIILLDMNFTIDTSGKQGIKLLSMIRAAHPKISIILMTGWATVQLAVQGMKIGARDFIAKPWDNKELLRAISTIEELHHSDEPLTGNANRDVDAASSNIIGSSPQMAKIMSLVDRVANTDASVLITGKSGTGKELIAEAIHQKSQRKDGPFVKVNLGGIPINLFESEMFGHKKGAFTGAQIDRDGRFSRADHGTIFLDEIGELPLANQVKLLRVLQEKTFEKLGSSNSIRSDFRTISATNCDLKSMADDGSFREDLYYRINLIHIHLPSLAERKNDIPELIKYFLNNISILYNTDRPYIDEQTNNWLANQEYKGNIRQLKNIVERTFLLHLDHKQLVRKDFEPAFDNATFGKAKDELNLEQMEIETIKKALAKHDHAISSAAKALGITRSSLYRRIEKYHIPYEPKI